MVKSKITFSVLYANETCYPFRKISFHVTVDFGRILMTFLELIVTVPFFCRLYYPKTLPEFYEKIQTNLKTHELNNCFEKLHFFTEPKFGFNVLALNAICPSCDYYTPILELL